jgi:hypothetical protein
MPVNENLTHWDSMNCVMHKITLEQKMGLKKDIAGSRRKQLRWYGQIMRITKLLDRLQNGPHDGKEARQTSQYMEGWE